MARNHSDTYYTFKVSLLSARRQWGTVSLRGDRTLSDLHGTICLAFGRRDELIYSFYFPKAETGGYMPGLYPKEYTSRVMLEQPDPFSRDQPSDASTTTLDSLHLLVGQTFEYLFDFGESSLHEIRVTARQSLHFDRKLKAVARSHFGFPEARA